MASLQMLVVYVSLFLLHVLDQRVVSVSADFTTGSYAIFNIIYSLIAPQYFFCVGCHTPFVYKCEPLDFTIEW